MEHRKKGQTTRVIGKTLLCPVPASSHGLSIGSKTNCVFRAGERRGREPEQLTRAERSKKQHNLHFYVAIFAANLHLTSWLSKWNICYSHAICGTKEELALLQWSFIVIQCATRFFLVDNPHSMRRLHICCYSTRSTFCTD
jgi:hypothetical protein